MIFFKNNYFGKFPERLGRTQRLKLAKVHRGCSKKSCLTRGNCYKGNCYKGNCYKGFFFFIVICDASFSNICANVDSKFDSTKALINKTGRALRARQSGFCRAFVESDFESSFCVNTSNIMNMNTKVTAVRVSTTRVTVIIC